MRAPCGRGGHVGHGGGWPAPIVHLSSDAWTAGASPGTAAVAPFPRRRRTWHEPRALLSIRGGAARTFLRRMQRALPSSPPLLPHHVHRHLPANHPPAATLQRILWARLGAKTLRKAWGLQNLYCWISCFAFYGALFLVARRHNVAN